MDVLHHSSSLNQLFAALYDLNFSRTTKAGLLVKVAPYETFSRRRLGPCRRLCAELMAYLHYLSVIYTGLSPHSWPLGVIHAKYYANWAALFSALGREKAYHKMLMKKVDIWLPGGCTRCTLLARVQHLSSAPTAG
jgi:hypothetical protein